MSSGGDVAAVPLRRVAAGPYRTADLSGRRGAPPCSDSLAPGVRVVSGKRFPVLDRTRPPVAFAR